MPRRPADAPRPPRGIAIDERLAADANVRLGDRVVLAGRAGGPGDTAVVAAIVRRDPDPSEVARGEYQVRLHLTHLQRLTGSEERVDRFAVATRGARGTDSALRAINAAAFGFRAHRSADVAAGTSRTFEVVRRFHRAIAVITVVASAAFLLCILLLKVDERRRDVAALRLMGVSRRTVVASVVLEAAAVALAGSAIGTLVGWATTHAINWHYQGVYRTPLAFAVLTPGTVAFAVGLSIALGVVAGFVAALRLASTPPLRLFGR
jgi:putative ABC transport system permease protein